MKTKKELQKTIIDIKLLQHELLFIYLKEKDLLEDFKEWAFKK